jgi:type VI secretion system secreted protein VgrG
MKRNPQTSRRKKAGIRAAQAKNALLSLFAIVPLLSAFSPTDAAATPILGSAQSFAVLGHETVTNGHNAPNVTTQVFGNVGLTPGTSITGFYPDGVVSDGTIHINDGVAQTAQADATGAYTMLAGLPTTYDFTGLLLGAGGFSTLTPAVYNFDSTAYLTGNLTLDFQNTANTDFVFNIGSSLTTASNSSVHVVNGNATNGVYWRVGSSATLGTDTSFAGNILALASIGLDPRAEILCGRAIALTGAVTMTDNRISKSSTPGLANGCSDFGSIGFSGGSITSGGGEHGGGEDDGGEHGGGDGGENPAPVPEPGTLMLMGGGLLGLRMFMKRRQNAKI